MLRSKSLIEAKIQNIVSSWYQRQYFTHCYVAVGSLEQNHPRFECREFADDCDLFDLASITKALVTAPLVLKWLGTHAADATVGDLNACADAPLSLSEELLRVKVSALLSHTSGLPGWTNFWTCRLDPATTAAALRQDAREHIAAVMARQQKWLSSPADCYSDIGFILLGALIEGENRLGLDQSFAASVGTNSDMTSAIGFMGAHATMSTRAISTGFCAVRQRELKGEVHDENCAALGSVSGHAGLFGTGPGLINCLRNLWQSPVGESLRSTGMGWRRGDDKSSSGFGLGKAIGHMGFTGTAFWVLPAEGLYAVILSNRVISGRVSGAIKEFRGEIFSLLHQLV